MDPLPEQLSSWYFRHTYRMTPVSVDSTSRAPWRRKCIWCIRSLLSSGHMQYHVLVSLFSTGWLPSACRGEKETPSLNPTGTNLIFVYFDHLKITRLRYLKIGPILKILTSCSYLHPYLQGSFRLEIMTDSENDRLYSYWYIFHILNWNIPLFVRWQR